MTSDSPSTVFKDLYAISMEPVTLSCKKTLALMRVQATPGMEKWVDLNQVAHQAACKVKDHWWVEMGDVWTVLVVEKIGHPGLSYEIRDMRWRYNTLFNSSRDHIIDCLDNDAALAEKLKNMPASLFPKSQKIG